MKYYDHKRIGIKQYGIRIVYADDQLNNRKRETIIFLSD
jgi:hypothetical protein